MKLALSLTAKGATGATFKTAAKLTVKKPKKKKARKKKAKQKQEGGGGSALDGKYGKDSGGPDLRFTVTGGGRKIVNLTGSIGGYCSTYVPFGGGIRSEFKTMFPGMTSLAVAADGTFSGSQKLSDTTTEITDGKLAGGIATGKVKVTSPGASRARRASSHAAPAAERYPAAASGSKLRAASLRRYTIWPRSSSSSSARVRVVCTQICSPSPSVSSTRTSKPR